MIFNGIQKDYITVLRGRTRPAWTSKGELKFVKVPVLIKHDGFTDLQRKKEDMAGWLIHEEYKKLEFHDEPNRLYLAKVESEMRLEEYSYWAEGEIEFICKEKYSKEKYLLVNLTSTNIIGGYRSTNWKTKTTFATNQSGYEIIFKSPGKTELHDIGKIKLNYNFIAGDVLQIDYSKRKVTVNGSDITNAVVILQSNFMKLPIGQVEFSANHNTEFYYNERFY
ncbi:distal tail protein Dit [Virgibacillus sp. MG-45]|uniref:distal tail protein Dit n=1 Tax=Virgibacillus sp. MG-45 TaxID=3102791 RepID=UPI002ED78B3E